MRDHRGRIGLYLLLGLLGMVLGCGPGAAVAPGTAEAPVVTPPAVAGTTIEAEANRDGVFTVQGSGRQTLPAPQQALLAVGDGVDVDQNGRAILRFADLLTVEVLRDGELTVQQVAVDQQAAAITVLQNGGALLNDFNPAKEIDRRLTVQGNFAVVTATGTRFLVVREGNSPLEWVVGLDAAAGDLTVSAGGGTETLTSGMARWVAPIGEPSPGIAANMGNIDNWVAGLQQGVSQREIGEVIWAPADVVADTTPLSQLPPPGQLFNLQNNAPGAVQLTLDPQGLAGSPVYSLEDCNGDSIQDLVIQGGRLLFDFRPVIGRVRALDVTVINRDQPGSASVRVLDPARAEITTTPVTAGPEEGQVVSLRSDRVYHYAELAMSYGCFLGFSLTPPTASGGPGEARPAVEQWQRGQGSVPPSIAPFVRIEEPADGAGDVTNGFILRGESSVPFERQLVLQVETAGGQVIQTEPLYVEGGDYGGPPGIFQAQVTVNYDLPADIRLRVQQLSPRDGSIIVEDSIWLRPLQPQGGGSQGSAEPAERPPENGRLVAVPLGRAGYGDMIAIDGSPDDWSRLVRASGVDWANLAATVYDGNCAARYPNAPSADAPDLAGGVALGYDEAYLYLAFRVADEGYVYYSGGDGRYYRGDAPQLLLDLDLAGDFSDPAVSGDDVQLDFQPGLRRPGVQPRAALWQLATLTVQELGGAQLAAAPTQNGYFLEAAVPWQILGLVPRPGLSLGAAANVSDNDTPGTQVQECMISNAPRRDWQNPTTWGTLLLAEK